MPPKLPYFDQGQVIQYVLPNASSIQLDCPVKNYDGKWASLGGVVLPPTLLLMEVELCSLLC